MADNTQTPKLVGFAAQKCGGKTRTQIRPRTVLEEFPLFCPKCKYTCVIRFKDGKIEELKMPDA
ncbi:MAG: cysteine-rich KTR domain-containing protein [Oscillospiraceae bacterium]